MGEMLFANRPTWTSRDVRAGCFVCNGSDAKWFGGSAQGVAARHHDHTGHDTWCDVAMLVRYGRATADARQTDIEDAIAASRSGDRPVSIPLTDSDASAPTRAGVSAPKAAQSEHALAAAKPETQAS